MSFSIGIVGLPNVGKSTLFKTLTRIPVDIAAYPFTTLHPNVGMIHIPDEKLEKIAEIIKPEKVTSTVIEFIDIAGLVKGSHKGEGLGNQFLAQIKNCNAILEVVRCFKNPEVENVLPSQVLLGKTWEGEEEINPEKEIEIIKTEFLMKDLETLENAISKIEKDVKSKNKKVLHPPQISSKFGRVKKFELLKRIKERVAEGKKILEIDLTDEEKLEIKEYQLLTQKPILYLLNINGKNKHSTPSVGYLAINLKEEEEISELSDSEVKELGMKSRLDQLIISCYDILDLLTFYTVAGGKETRAWTLKRGGRAPEAGGVVHTDFKEKFIRAEIIPWQKLVEAGSWLRAREKGLVKTVGKDYIVKDGDVIEFKI